MTEATQMDKRILDRVAAFRSQAIVDTAVALEKVQAKDVDNLATKALGVLQENGVYACFLFLCSRTRDAEKLISAVVQEQLLKLAGEDLPFCWRELRDVNARDASSVLRQVSATICAQLDPLLMTKELFELTLIYVRYGSKALKNEGK